MAWLSSFAFLLLLLLPAAASGEVLLRGVGHDPSAYPEPWVKSRTVLLGAATTAVWYGGAAGMSLLFPDAPGAEALRIPVVGPWLSLADTGCPEDEPNCNEAIVIARAILTILDGVGQAGGLLVVLEGLFLPTKPRGTSAATRSATAPSGSGGRTPRTRVERTLTPYAQHQRFDIAATLRPTATSFGSDGVLLGLHGHF